MDQKQTLLVQTSRRSCFACLASLAQQAETPRLQCTLQDPYTTSHWDVQPQVIEPPQSTLTPASSPSASCPA
jgi:hypothetical protein